MGRVNVDKKYGGLGFGGPKVEAGLTADIKRGLYLGGMGACVNAEAHVNIPVPFTRDSIKLGVEGYLFGLGGEISLKNNEFKAKACPIVGAGIVIGYNNN